VADMLLIDRLLITWLAEDILS